MLLARVHPRLMAAKTWEYKGKGKKWIQLIETCSAILKLKSSMLLYICMFSLDIVDTSFDLTPYQYRDDRTIKCLHIIYGPSLVSIPTKYIPTILSICFIDRTFFFIILKVLSRALLLLDQSYIHSSSLLLNPSYSYLPKKCRINGVCSVNS